MNNIGGQFGSSDNINKFGEPAESDKQLPEKKEQTSPDAKGAENTDTISQAVVAGESNTVEVPEYVNDAKLPSDMQVKEELTALNEESSDDETAVSGQENPNQNVGSSGPQANPRVDLSKLLTDPSGTPVDMDELQKNPAIISCSLYENRFNPESLGAAAEEISNIFSPPESDPDVPEQ